MTNSTHLDLYRSDRQMVLVALGGNALIHAGESGTMIGPKVQAVVNFLEYSGKGRRAIITRADRLDAALDGTDGTEFYR